MKSELRLARHTDGSGAVVVEVWYGQDFIASVYGADGPGVRVVTKHRITVDHLDPHDVSIGAVTVHIGR